MSQRALELASGPIERVPADVAVVPLFAGERPLRDAAGRVDWRLCGRLSHLFAAGRLCGDDGEAVLMPGGGGMRAPRVLGLGLGARPELDAGRWEHWIAEALARAAALGARHAAIALPASAAALVPRLNAVAACALRGAAPEESSLAPEPADEAGVGEWLRAAARRQRPAELEVRPPAWGPQGAGDAWSSRDSGSRSTR